MTCLTDIRSTSGHVRGLIFLTPTVTSFEQVLVRQGGGVSQVLGLTKTMKILLALFCLLPRLVSTLLLLVLGCRWLMATNDMADLLLNALALEFMISLKYLLYTTMASKRNQTLTANTHINGPPHGKMGLFSALGAGLWLVVALVWVYAYTFHLQQVLPEYQWDVREVCATWKGAQHMR